MKQTFLHDSQPVFEQHETPASTLFHYGRINMPWDKVVASLEDGRFPDDVRGNFAFVWCGADETIAAVDHLATFPLSYTDDHIGHIFVDVVDTVKDRTANPRATWEMKFLRRFTISEETVFTEVRRLRPGHYLRDGKQVQFIELDAFEGKSEFDKEYFMDLFETGLRNNLREENALFLSTGTDSMTVCGALKKMGLLDKVKCVHVYSKVSLYSELALLRKLERRVGFEAAVFCVDGHQNDYLPDEVTRRIKGHGFWFDRVHLEKARALYAHNLQDRLVLTGEIGDQLFGGPKLSGHLAHVLQADSWDEIDIARQVVNMSLRASDTGVKPSPSVELYIEQQGSGAREVYDEVIETMADMFRSMRTDDVVNQFLLRDMLVKGPYRVWGTSQDLSDDYHPFAEWDLVSYLLDVPADTKIRERGTVKWRLWDCYKDFVPHIVWRKPKLGATF